MKVKEFIKHLQDLNLPEYEILFDVSESRFDPHYIPVSGTKVEEIEDGWVVIT